MPMWMYMAKKTTKPIYEKPIVPKLKLTEKPTLKEVTFEPNEKLDDDDMNDNKMTEADADAEADAEADEETEDDGFTTVGSQTCVTDGCTVKFDPIATEKRCTDCRVHKTAYIRECTVDDCTEKIYMSFQNIKDGKAKFGADFKYYTKCMTHSKKPKKINIETETMTNTEEDTTIVYDMTCIKDECNNKVMLNQSQLNFFQQDHMEIPKYCNSCRKERKSSKETMIECNCVSCDDTFEISEMMKSSLESKKHLITCGACRKTNTRTCNYCRKSFFSMAQEAALRKQYKKDFKPPSCCSKECAGQSMKEKQKK
jgi:hypothetical protein